MSDNAYNIQMTSPAPAPLPAPQTAVPGRTMSIIALILPFLCCWPVGIVLAIVGFVQGKGHPRGLAIAALIVNVLFMCLSIVGMLLSPSESDFSDLESVNAPSSYSQPVKQAGPPTVTTTNAHAIADALEAEIDSDK